MYTPNDAVSAEKQAAVLLSNESGLDFVVPAPQQVQLTPGVGTGLYGLGPSTGVTGCVPVHTKAGKLLATLRFWSNDRELSQMSGDITLADGTPFAQFERSPRSGTLSLSFPPTMIQLGGKPYASMNTGKSGSLERTDGTGGLGYNILCCQPGIKALAFAFCCFFPTFGISACVGMYIAQNSTTRTSISSVDGTTKYPQVVFAKDGDKEFLAHCDFGTLDAQGKQDLLILVACQLAHRLCMAPGGGGAHGGGGP